MSSGKRHYLSFEAENGSRGLEYTEIRNDSKGTDMFFKPIRGAGISCEE